MEYKGGLARRVPGQGLSLLLYSPAHDGEHIKCSPVRAELATTLICLRPAPSAAHWERHVDVCLTLLAQLITLLGVHYLLKGELALEGFAFCLWR